MKTFPARYRGICAKGCGEPIKVGDEVGYNDDDQITHADCDTAIDDHNALDNPAPRGICSHCFMAVPASGVCDCRD